MPMKSQAERGYLWANKPDVARKLEADGPSGKIPYKIGPKKGPLHGMFSKKAP